MARPFEMITLKEHFEMVVFDKHGHDIHVVVPTIFKQTFDSILKHDIQDKLRNLTPFANIIFGKWQRNVLCGGKQPQVNLVLHDLGDTNLNYTQWEACAMEFLEYKQKLADSTKQTVILLRYAKVKEQGKFPPAVTNTYNLTMLHINEDINVINDFIKRLLVDSSFGKSLTTTSIHTRGLDKIIQLGEPTFCITVAIIDKLIASKNESSFLCRAGHRTKAEIWRYKILIEVIHEGNTTKFVFWDHEAAMLLDTSSTQMRATMIQAGITNPLEFPLALDAMLEKKFAFKVKWDLKWKSSFVVQFIKDEQLIAHLEGPQAINQNGEITSPPCYRSRYP
ncbi:unnamed protein product [Vicia faba]|uniref:Uncharacterized protein n=1 Tax=Vicia faba TaxID=3906 RepID=A0AAV1AQS0_VICFA|nr:unnamed protein product [Vicia faba]